MYKSGNIMSGHTPPDVATIAPKKLYSIAVLWMMIIAQNSDFSSNQLVWWGSVGLFLAAFVISYRTEIYFDSYALWILTFIVISISSVLWAITPSLVFGTIKSMIVNALILILIRSSIRTPKDIEFLLKLLLIACIINAVYLVFTNIDVLTAQERQEVADRLGSQEGWNANSVGLMTSITTVIAMYFFKSTTEKKIKVLLAVVIVLLGFLSLASGSRKAFFILIGGVAAYLYFSFKGKRVRIIILILLLVVLLWYLIMEVPYFYSVVGWRVEAMFSQFTGKGELDSSAISRQKLVEAAIEAWKESPIIGHGLDCFRYFGKIATGRDYYAHNNYVEILADLGLLGFISYYSGYLYVLMNSWKKRKNRLSLLFFVLICTMIVTEYGCVTYTDFLFGTLIMLMFANSRFKVKEDANE